MSSSWVPAPRQGSCCGEFAERPALARGGEAVASAFISVVYDPVTGFLPWTKAILIVPFIIMTKVRRGETQAGMKEWDSDDFSS